MNYMLQLDLGQEPKAYGTLTGDSANDLPAVEYLPSDRSMRRRFGPSFTLPDMRPISLTEWEEDFLVEEINQLDSGATMDHLYNLLNGL